MHLVDGALLVGHDEEDLNATRKPQSLYLDPIRDYVRTSNGRALARHSLTAGVDLISTDDLRAYRDFVLQRTNKSPNRRTKP